MEWQKPCVQVVGNSAEIELLAAGGGRTTMYFRQRRLAQIVKQCVSASNNLFRICQCTIKELRDLPSHLFHLENFKFQHSTVKKKLLGTIIAFDIFNQIFLTIINYVPFRVYFNLHL